MRILPKWFKSVLGVVEVNRSPILNYPGELVHPEIEREGPGVFSSMRIRKQSLTNGFSSEKRTDVFHDLEKSGKLRLCLGLHDAMAIREKGTDFFYRTFGYETTQLFFWKSVVRGWKADPSVFHGALFVPVLTCYSRNLELIWDDVGDFGSISGSYSAYFGWSRLHLQPRSSYEKLMEACDELGLPDYR